MSREDDAFAKEYEPFVRGLARKLRAEFDLTADSEELVAFGFAGLVEARSRFDASRGVQFNTFAYYRVRGAMIDGVRKMSHHSRHAHQARKLAEAQDAVLEEYGDARAAGTEREFESTVAAIDDVLGKITAAYVMAAVGQDPHAEQRDPERDVAEAQLHDRVRAAMTKLPEREAEVVRRFYFEGDPLDDIAKDLGVSKSWASRIHTKALAIMKVELERTAS